MYSAVSLSILWLIVATTFILNKNLIISLDFSAIRFESSWIDICSGILTSLITFLNSFFSSPSGLFFFSFNLALLTDAKLLCFISISSTFNALDTVNLKSRLSIGALSFSLLFPAGLLSFFIKSFVACCSINFLAKFFFFWSGFLKFVVVEVLLVGLFVLKCFFFSMENDFFPAGVKEPVFILFLKFDEIVRVFFLSFSITLFVSYLSCSHN